MNQSRRKKGKRPTRPEVSPALPPPDFPWKHASWLVALLAIIMYLPSAGYGFVLDDFAAIVENSITRGGIRSIPVIFETSYRFGYPLQGDELYRPIPKSFFAIFWSLAPNNSLPGHLFNILLYAGTGILLIMTGRRFFPDHFHLVVLASLLFITHPVHIEVVTNIKSADELLGFFFFLISLFGLYNYLKNRRWMGIVLAMVCFFAALLSKESSITFLAVYPLLIFYGDKTAMKRMWPAVAWMALPALIFLGIRSGVVGNAFHEPSMADNVLMSAPDWISRKTSAIYFLGYGLKLLVFPFPLVFDYSYNQLPLAGPGDWQFLISASVLVILLGYTLLRIKHRDPVAFGILFYFITISISSNLFITIGTHFAERLLYVPSFGFCFAVASLAGQFLVKVRKPVKRFQGLFVQNKAYLFFASFLCLGFMACTWYQMPVWKSNLTLYESGVMHSPESHRTHYYLGNYLVKKENYVKLNSGQQAAAIQRGLTELRKASAILPSFADAYLHIGNYYSGISETDSALFYFNTALEVQPGLATALNNRGTVYFNLKQYDKAIMEFMEATRYDPNYMHAFRNLGSVYGTVGNYPEAIRAFQKAYQLDAHDAECNYYLGITYQSMGNHSLAQQYLEKAAALDPRFSK